ncbi:MAG TPA: prolyl oligopeptidase family serine peptidase [Saprospiraceae bacterium]|nr:prolyl oligopeptidase family serine peptidase [Saprospiraceae bacterium]
MKKLFLLLCLCSFHYLCAQQPELAQRYERAISHLNSQLVGKQVFNQHIDIHWFPDHDGAWYLHESPGKKEYLKFTFPDPTPAVLFDHAQLASLLSDVLGEEVDADDLPISRLDYESDGELSFWVQGKSYQLDVKKMELRPQVSDETSGDRRQRKSPDDKWMAYSKNYNLYLKNLETGKERQMTTDGARLYTYGSWYGWGDILEGENAERPENFRVNWSPDGKWIHAEICDLRNANKMYLLDWSVDSLYRPRLLSYYRGSPGDTGMVYQIPAFINIKTGKQLRPDIPNPTHINGVSVRWGEESDKVYLIYASRGYQNQYIQSYDLNTGDLEMVYQESSLTNIDNFWYRFDSKKEYLYFLSEKSGWRQLYRLHLETREEEALTQGDYYIHEVEHIDEAGGEVLFQAAGKEAGANPYHRYLYRLKIGSAGPELLTPETANHEIAVSADGKYFVDNISTIEQATRTVLRSTEEGEILMELGKALLVDMAHWVAPETFTAIARDGETTIYGALWRPTHFDPNQKYPVIDATYTGPHTQRYPRSFRSAFYEQAMAELGFIVVRVDGLGSSGRSKAFHDYSYKNLGGNLEDHVRAIIQLGEKYDWVDTSRVGIFGHSAGGYDAAHALLAFPDFYKVGVASSADHDHRMEKAWWPEMYMGWPVDEAYEEQSNITMAENLQGKLLITHGGIDENVNPSATFKLAEALVQADKQFDMKIFPSQRHGYRGQVNQYFTKLRWNYFVEHLLGEPPLWDIDIP